MLIGQISVWGVFLVELSAPSLTPRHDFHHSDDFLQITLLFRQNPSMMLAVKNLGNSHHHVSVVGGSPNFA
jgi:hypothetical protein